jgi:hypothetical protein
MSDLVRCEACGGSFDRTIGPRCTCGWSRPADVERFEKEEARQRQLIHERHFVGKGLAPNPGEQLWADGYNAGVAAGRAKARDQVQAMHDDPDLPVEWREPVQTVLTMLAVCRG